MAQEQNSSGSDINSTAADVVKVLNEQFGCPHAVKPVPMGDMPVAALNPRRLKGDYYASLVDNEFLPEIMSVIRKISQSYPEGIVRYDAYGEVAGGLDELAVEVAPYVVSGDFTAATQAVHGAVAETAIVATAEWRLKHEKTPKYQRATELLSRLKGVTDEDALMQRVTMAINVVPSNSCSFQVISERLFPESNGRGITAAEMQTAHEKNQRLAMPLTQLHSSGAKLIREILGVVALEGTELEVYDLEQAAQYLIFRDGGLAFRGTRMQEKIKEYPCSFDTDRIGCPGAKYVPELWKWVGNLSAKYAFPALDVRDAGVWQV